MSDHSHWLQASKAVQCFAVVVGEYSAVHITRKSSAIFQPSGIVNVKRSVMIKKTVDIRRENFVVVTLVSRFA